MKLFHHGGIGFNVVRPVTGFIEAIKEGALLPTGQECTKAAPQRGDQAALNYSAEGLGVCAHSKLEGQSRRHLGQKLLEQVIESDLGNGLAAARLHYNVCPKPYIV